MDAQILSTIPNSGEYSEIHFGENYNSQLWVKFTNENFEEWVGCFSKSFENGLCKVLINEKNSLAFVVAGGKGYLIDISKRQLITQLDGQPLIESVIKTTNPDYFLAGTFYSIYVLNELGLFDEIRPDYTIDGIYLKEQIENKAIGELATAENQYEKNVDFELDLTTFQLTLNSNKALSVFGKIWNTFRNN